MQDKHIVDGPVAAARAVRAQVERGAHWIKVALTGGLYSKHETVDGGQFSDEELGAVLRTANQRKIPVAAHCGGSAEAIRFAKLGGRSVEHGYALDEEAASVMVEHGTWLVPTIGVTHDLEWVDSPVRPAHARSRSHQARPAHRGAIEICHAAGVRFAIGADLNPIGPRLHREFELLQEAGIPRLEVLHAATVGGRELNGFSGASTPEHGTAADLVIWDGDPLAPGPLPEPALVVAQGRILHGPGAEHFAATWDPDSGRSP